MGELAQELGAMAQLSLKHDGQVAVGAEGFQVEVSHAPELLARVGDIVERRPCPLYKAVEGGIDGRHEQFVFIFEIKVDGAIGHSGPVGNLGNPRMKKTMLGDHLNGGIEDALVLVRGSAI